MATDGAPSERAVWACGVAVALAVLAFLCFHYWMPAGLTSGWGVNPEGAAHFRTAFHLPIHPVEVASFRRGFLALLALMAAAYLCLLACCAAGATIPLPRMTWLARGLVPALAIFAPPALSPDVYAYVGYARLALVHHLNPYVATQRVLIQLHDVTAPFLHWPIASPYGPLWTLVCIAIELPLRAAPLVVAIVAMKLVGAAAVLAIAAGGRRLADHVASGSGPRTFAALALNPLLLVEGVGSAHNDVVMMAAVIWLLVLAARGRLAWALLLAGLATAVKFLPLLLVPWLLLVCGRGEPLARRARSAAAALGLVLAPTALSYAAFWHGGDLFAGLRGRWALGHARAGDGNPLRAAVVLVAVYALLSLWVSRGDLTRVLRAWIIQSLFVVFVATGVWFPWYFAWPWTASLVLLRGRDVVFAAVLFIAAFLLMAPYVF
ncbi:MAG TPA: hypothetical protein VH560_18460 [Polyangia bacterium]|jgi:hypothetical protein|nr:hypothetical protein [Polyangia bacterium]